MARFNLADYETVAERTARFYKDHKNGAIITKNLTTDADRERKQWVVYAEVWFDKNVDVRPTGTGLAFEIDGGAGANLTSALENCESSSVGRALMNASYGGDKRVTREEMRKVNRGAPCRDANHNIRHTKRCNTQRSRNTMVQSSRIR